MLAELEVDKNEKPIITTLVGLGVKGREVLKTIAELRLFNTFFRGVNIAPEQDSAFQRSREEAHGFSVDVPVRGSKTDNKTDSFYDSNTAGLDVILQESDFTILLADYSEAFTADFLKTSLDRIKRTASTTILFVSGMSGTATHTEEAITDAVSSYFPLKDSELEDASLIISNLYSKTNDNQALIPLEKKDLLKHFSSGALSYLGRGSGNTAADAVSNAMNSPLLSRHDLHSASSLLVSVTCALQFTVAEFSEVCDAANEIVNDSANVVVGIVQNPGNNAKYYITLILAGINDHKTSG